MADRVAVLPQPTGAVEREPAEDPRNFSQSMVKALPVGGIQLAQLKRGPETGRTLTRAEKPNHGRIDMMRTLSTLTAGAVLFAFTSVLAQAPPAPAPEPAPAPAPAAPAPAAPAQSMEAPKAEGKKEGKGEHKGKAKGHNKQGKAKGKSKE